MRLRRLALVLCTVSPAAFGSEPMPATAADVAGILGKIGEEDRGARGRLGALADEGARTHSLVIARGRAYVKMARAGLLPVGGGLDTLVDHASRLERLRLSLARDLDRERAIAAERLSLARRRESLGDRRALLETEHAALARSHTAILAAEDRETAFRRAFVGSREDTPHTAVYGSGFGPLDPSDLLGGFAAQKGRLPFPLEGRVEIRPVTLPNAEGPGLEMAASPGAPVRSVYPGRVAFADAYADYGLSVIVDHGGGYYTVTAKLGGTTVTVGQEIGAGDRIGTVGGVTARSSIYFELRHGARTTNAAPWFGI